MDDSPTISDSNREQAARWNGPDGEEWASHADDYDASMRRYQPHLMAAAAIGSHERVLDLGCGPGVTTLDAARAATDGTVTALDVSAPMLAAVRQRATAAGLMNVTFIQGDAQVYPFQPEGFDVAISRNGVMFFGDQHEAFSNIGRAIRPGGRLVLLVWQGIGENEWWRETRSGFGILPAPPAPPPGTPGPVALGDRDDTVALLSSCGFTDVDLTGVREPMFFGNTVEAARDDLLSQYRGELDELDAPTREHAVAALTEKLRAHLTPDGVAFGSAAWLVRARRP